MALPHLPEPLLKTRSVGQLHAFLLHPGAQAPGLAGGDQPEKRGNAQGVRIRLVPAPRKIVERNGAEHLGRLGRERNGARRGLPEARTDLVEKRHDLAADAVAQVLRTPVRLVLDVAELHASGVPVDVGAKHAAPGAHEQKRRRVSRGRKSRDHELARLRKGGESFGPRAAHPLHEEGLDTVVLVMRRQHDVIGLLACKACKRPVADLAGRGLDAFARLPDRHAHGRERNAPCLALGATVRLPVVRIGREAVIDVDRMHAGDEKLARTMKELLDDVKEHHGVAPARKRHDDAHGIERPEREFVPLDAEKRFGRIGERVVDELRQTLGERLRAARRGLAGWGFSGSVGHGRTGGTQRAVKNKAVIVLRRATRTGRNPKKARPP